MQEEHHRDHTHEGDPVAHDRDDAGREDLADRLHVPEHPGHEAAHRVPIEEGGGQPLDVGEERRPEVVHDLLARPRRDVGLAEAERVLDDQGPEEEEDDPRRGRASPP